MEIPLRLLSKILETVQSALKDLTAEDRVGARRHIDHLRQLRSFMADHIEENDQAEWVGLENYHEIALEAAQVVNRSLTTLELISTQFCLPESLIDESDFHLILDKILPPVWDWESDVFVFIRKPHPNWYKVLQDRGQKRILCVLNDVITKLDCPGSWLFVNDIQDIDEAIQLWHPFFPKRHIIFESSFYKDIEIEPHAQSVIDALVRGNVEQNTIAHFSELWIRQQYQNAKQAVTSFGLSDLRRKLCGRDVVIISPGPSLAKNINVLRENSTKFVIIAVAQACPALVSHNIVPDFVIVIDPIDYSKILDGLDCSKSALIIDDRCSPAFFKKEFREFFVLSSHFSLCGIPQVTGEDLYVEPGLRMKVQCIELLEL